MKQESTKSLKIVYVDDEPDLCEVFVDAFSNKDLDVKTFCDSKIALDFINNNKVDLIFIDYRMPGINGEQFASKIMNQSPKFLITGEIDLKTNFQFAQILKKPFEMQKIESIIQDFKDKING